MSNTNNASIENQTTIEVLLSKSRETDIPALLQAKEKAKQSLRHDPSQASVLARIDSMLDKAVEKNMPQEIQEEAFRSAGDVLRYLEEAGRQIKKTKLYEDVKKGLLRKTNKKFRKKDVDRYAASLPKLTTPDGRVAQAESMQARKEAAEVRRLEAIALREEKKNAVMDGSYISRDDVYQELAARAVTLNAGIKSHIQVEALDLIMAVSGDKQKTDLLVRKLEEIVDRASNEYARDLEFEVNLHGFDDNEDEPIAIR